MARCIWFTMTLLLGMISMVFSFLSSEDDYIIDVALIIMSLILMFVSILGWGISAYKYTKKGV